MSTTSAESVLTPLLPALLLIVFVVLFGWLWTLLTEPLPALADGDFPSARQTDAVDRTTAATASRTRPGEAPRKPPAASTPTPAAPAASPLTRPPALDAGTIDDTASAEPFSTALNELYARLHAGGGRLEPDDLSALLELLKLLSEQHRAALPAVREFLRSGLDLPLRGGRSPLPASLRLAIIAVLERIDDPRVVEPALDALSASVAPAEIPLLAALLERHAPGVYRDELIASADFLLNRSAADGVAQGPLFQVLSEYGGIDAAELRQMPRYQQQYATVALALLPDGQGIPALLTQVSATGAGADNEQRRLALQLLAQNADRAAAAEELISLARQDSIPEWLWPDIAAMVGGEQRIQLTEPAGRTLGRHFVYKPEGTQLLYRARPDAPPPDQLRARLAVLEQLAEVSVSAAAGDALGPLLARLRVRIDVGLR